MKAFDPNYKLLDEMYQDDYYPAFLVDKVNPFLPKQTSLPSQEWMLGVSALGSCVLLEQAKS